MAYNRRWLSFLSSSPSRSKNRAFDSLWASGARCGAIGIAIGTDMGGDVSGYQKRGQEVAIKVENGCQPRGAAVEASF